MWRILTGLTICMAALTGCAQPAAPLTKGFHAQACKSDFSGVPNKVECGTMVVDEARGSDNGRLISFPVVIVRTTAAVKQADPVIYLHGGPGGGVVAGLAKRLTDGRAPAMTDRDWIFFDQRGGESATPSLDCGQLPLSDAGVTSDDGVTQLKGCGEKWKAQGVDLSQYNSAVIAQDIGDLRHALGIKAYNLYGVSYGTRVAMAVMHHDPSDLRAVVLDSTWPPEASATGPLPVLVSREVRQVLALCAADAACHAKYPDGETKLDALLTAWLKAPVQVKGKTYTADGVASYLLDAIYDSTGARKLPASIDRLVKGDYADLDAYMVAQSDYVEGQFFTHLCKEEFPFENPADIQGVSGADPIARAVARDAQRFFQVCPGFAIGTLDPVENQLLVSSIPTLMLSADIDAGCPAELSESAVKRLDHGQYFFFPNRTHGVARQSPCAKGMISAFLADPVAKVDAACIKDDQPKFQFIL